MIVFFVRAVFLNLSKTIILGQIILCFRGWGEGCPVYYRMFTIIPVSYPLDAGSTRPHWPTPPPQVWWPKISLDIVKCSRGQGKRWGRFTPIWELPNYGDLKIIFVKMFPSFTCVPVFFLYILCARNTQGVCRYHKGYQPSYTQWQEKWMGTTALKH